MDSEMREKIIANNIEGYTQRSLRTICLAYRDLEVNEGGEEHSNDAKDGIHAEIETNGLTFIAIIGMRDVLKPDIIDSVNIWHQAGIWVRMITGDHRIRAISIAKECGIIDSEENAVLVGDEFSERVGGIICKNCSQNVPCACLPHEVKESIKNKDEFIKIWKDLRVLARSRPEDKYLLLRWLQLMGDVVAVTGDGTGDGPTLKKADVGFSMGITGTDVAKEASSIVLLDDTFCSIIKTFKLSKNIYWNIRKVICFQYTLSFVALIVSLITTIWFLDNPIKPIQILWLNLIINFIVSILFIYDPPSYDLMTKNTTTQDQSIACKKIKQNILFWAIYQLILLLILIIFGDEFIPENWNNWPRKDNNIIVSGRRYNFMEDFDYQSFENEYGPSKHYTIVFIIFIILQLLNILNARRINDKLNIFAEILSNKLFLPILIGIFTLLIVFAQFTPIILQLNKNGLSLIQWIICICFSSSIFIAIFVIKLITEKRSIYKRKNRSKIENLNED